MLRHTAAALAILALAACQSEKSDPAPDKSAAAQPAKPAFVVPMASSDPAPGQPAPAEDMPRPVMQAQVVLERLGFAPGIIDGKEGLSTRNAVQGFQEANGIAVSGNFDRATMQALARWSNIPATRLVTIPDDFARGPFAPLPKEPAAQAKLKALGYASLEEKLAERFHTTPEVLREIGRAHV